MAFQLNPTPIGPGLLNPTPPPTGIKTTTPQTVPSMGVAAKSPQTNITPAPNTIPVSQQQPPQTASVASSLSVSPVVPPTYTPSSGNTSSGQGLYAQLIQKAQDDRDAYNKFYASYQKGLTDITGKPIGLANQTGQAAQYEKNYGTQLQSLNNQYQGDISLAGLASPANYNYQVAPGNTVYDANNAPVAGGIGGYANYETAQQVFSATSQYKDAVNSQGQPFTYDTTQSPQQNYQNFTENYLPNSRTYQSGLNSSGLTSNIGQPNSGGSSLSQATVNQANISGYQAAYKNYQDLNTQYQGAQNLGSLLTSTMQQYGINPNDPKIFNLTANEINNQLSSNGYTRFLSTLSNVQSAYSNILASGGGTIPTAATNALHTIIDPNASFGAIQSAIDQLNQEVITGKLTPLAGQVNQYLTNIPGSGNQGTPQGSSSTSGFGWNG